MMLSIFIYVLCIKKGLKTNRIVIIGGPASGKTTLINHLKKSGFDCLPEVSREIIKKAKHEGIDQLFLKDPILFSQKLLEGRVSQFQQAEDYESHYLFYDRGLPDVTAYLHYIKEEYPENFDEVCIKNRYDSVFLLPPWEQIYAADSERYETFEQALLIYGFLKKTYIDYGYIVTEVPKETIENRTAFILNHLNITT